MNYFWVLNFDGLIKNGRFRIYGLNINNQSLEKLKHQNSYFWDDSLKTITNTCGFEIFVENFLDSENS